MRTERGSTGPMWGRETAGGGQAGSKMQRQWPGATRQTSRAFAAAASNAGELTNTGSWLRLYSHTPSASRERVTPRPILDFVFRTWNEERVWIRPWEKTLLFNPCSLSHYQQFSLCQRDPRGSWAIWPKICDLHPRAPCGEFATGLRCYSYHCSCSVEYSTRIVKLAIIIADN